MFIQKHTEGVSILQKDEQVYLSANQLLAVAFYVQSRQDELKKEAEKELQKVRAVAKRDRQMRECGEFFLFRAFDGTIDYCLFASQALKTEGTEILERWCFTEPLQKWSKYAIAK